MNDDAGLSDEVRGLTKRSPWKEGVINRERKIEVHYCGFKITAEAIHITEDYCIFIAQSRVDVAWRVGADWVVFNQSSIDLLNDPREHCQYY